MARRKKKDVTLRVRMARKHAERFVRDHLPGSEPEEVLATALEIGLVQLRLSQARPKGAA